MKSTPIAVLSQIVPPDQALQYLIRYKASAGSRHSWGEVERDIQATKHAYAHLVDRKKLLHWETGRTVPDARFLEAVQSFMMTEQFTKFVPTLAGSMETIERIREYGRQIIDENEYEFKLETSAKLDLFRRISGMWNIDRDSDHLMLKKSLGRKRDDGTRNPSNLYLSMVVLERIPDEDFFIFHMFSMKFIPMSGLRGLEDKLIHSGLVFMSGSRDLKLHAFNRLSKERHVLSCQLVNNMPSYARRLAYGLSYLNPEIDDHERRQILYKDSDQIGFVNDNSNSRLERRLASSVLSESQSRLADEFFQAPTGKIINWCAVKRIFDKIYWSVIPIP